MGSRLPASFNDDAAADSNLDAQVMPVQQEHTHERGAARRVGLDMPRLTVPQNRNVVNVEAHFIIVGQKCPSYVSKWQPQLSHYAVGKVKKPL